MPITALVSYDDTLNDHDALGLARVLAAAGAELTLAYVRHTTNAEREREELEEHEAEALLERGARWLGDLQVKRRVVFDASTGEGLARLAEQEHADIVVFGSDYRTAPGHVAPQPSTQRLLEGGPAAVAIAPANYRAQREAAIGRIALLGDASDPAVRRTAGALSSALGATLVSEAWGADLLLVGSRPEAPQGRVMISSRAQNALEEATAPVLVLARGVALHVGTAVPA